MKEAKNIIIDWLIGLTRQIAKIRQKKWRRLLAVNTIGWEEEDKIIGKTFNK